jgi:hypothetical protein
MSFTVLTKLSFLMKLSFFMKPVQNDGSLENAVKKLQPWLNFSTAQHCNGNECCGNFTPTRLFI